MSFNVMAFDCGGMRSIISAALLCDIEARRELVGQTDLFVGTSSGAVIALALAFGIGPEAIANFFAEHAGQFYADVGAFADAGADWMEAAPDTVSAGNMAADQQLTKADIEAKHRSTLLLDALTGLFGDARLDELPRSGPQVAVTALQLGGLGQHQPPQWKPVLLGSGRNDPFSQMLLAEAAMASMATPTVFTPFKPSLRMGDRFGYFADGALFAGNPAVAGIEYAADHCGAGHADVHMVSFGAGMVPRGTAADPDRAVDSEGAWQWITPYSGQSPNFPPVPLIDAAYSASGQMAERCAQMILGDRFIRADFVLSRPTADCDGWTAASLRKMAAHHVRTDAWTGQTRAICDLMVKPDQFTELPTIAGSARSKSRLSQLFGL